jgi:hypothetical protein
MIRAILYALAGFILTMVIFALLAPLLFQGADMRKVGAMLGAPAALVGGILGFIIGLVRSRKAKQQKRVEQDVGGDAG